jgi:hypothetical protein
VALHEVCAEAQQPRRLVEVPVQSVTKVQ